MTKPPAPRVSWVLLVVLTAALATGAAASILVSAATAPPNPPPASLLILPQWFLSAVIVGALVVFVGVLVVLRIGSGRSSFLTRVTVSILVVIFLGILFVIGIRALGFGGPIQVTNSGGGPGSNSTTTNVTAPAPGGQVGGPGGQITLFPSVPAWVPFLLLGAVVLVVMLVGVPQVHRYLEERRAYGRRARASAAGVPTWVREALAQASSELDLGGDPRVVILALYRTMLEHLQPMVEDLGTSTPEEIRAAHLVRLGVRPDAARTLTRLFEEARYSTHPLGPATVARAQEALRATLDDLDRRAAVA